MDRKRYTIRFPEILSGHLIKISKERGLSVNALVTEIAWDFVNHFETICKRKGEEK